MRYKLAIEKKKSLKKIRFAINFFFFYSMVKKLPLFFFLFRCGGEKTTTTTNRIAGCKLNLELQDLSLQMCDVNLELQDKSQNSELISHKKSCKI